MPDTPLPHASPQLLDKVITCSRWIDFILSYRDTLERDCYADELSEAFIYLNNAEALREYGSLQTLGREIQQAIAVDPETFAYQNSANFTFTPVDSTLVEYTPQIRAVIQPYVRAYIRPVDTINVLTQEIDAWLLRVIGLFTVWADLLSGVAFSQERHIRGGHYNVVCLISEHGNNRNVNAKRINICDYFIERVVPLLLNRLELFTWESPHYSYEWNIGIINAIELIANARDRLSFRMKVFLGVSWHLVENMYLTRHADDNYCVQCADYVLSAIASSRVEYQPPDFTLYDILYEHYTKPFDRFALMNLTVSRWFNKVIKLFADWADRLRSFLPEDFSVAGSLHEKITRLPGSEAPHLRNCKIFLEEVIPTIHQAMQFEMGVGRYYQAQ